MARVSRVRHVAKVGKVKSTGHGRTTYRARKPRNIGGYSTPALVTAGRTLQEQDYGCPDVKSTAIESIGFNSDIGRMTVTFQGGGTYNYYGVSRQRYQAFCLAQSKGGYMNKVIKKEGHAYQRIG